MGNRIFVALVVLLWTGTMSWLMVARILPPFFNGRPPDQFQIPESDPNCWQISFSGQRAGYAVSQAVAGAAGTTEIHSRVVLEGIELRKLWPFQVGSLIHGLSTIRLDSRTRLAFDSLGRLSHFDNKVRLADVPLVMTVHGRVDGAQLVVALQSGETKHELRFPVPAGALLANELMPESKLADVAVGRKWQQEAFSPFKGSLEVIQAEVVAEAKIEHRGERRNARRIEYRNLSSSGVAADSTLRSVVWVADDGAVLRQDVLLMSATLRFERCSEPQMIEMARGLLDLKTVATTPARP
jgi:hypothetical protein